MCSHKPTPNHHAVHICLFSPPALLLNTHERTCIERRSNIMHLFVFNDSLMKMRDTKVMLCNWLTWRCTTHTCETMIITSTLCTMPFMRIQVGSSSLMLDAVASKQQVVVTEGTQVMFSCCSRVPLVVDGCNIATTIANKGIWTLHSRTAHHAEMFSTQMTLASSWTCRHPQTRWQHRAADLWEFNVLATGLILGDLSRQWSTFIILSRLLNSLWSQK